MSDLTLDAQALYADLLQGVRALCRSDTRLVGITSGGAWLAQRLQTDLALPGACGVISSAMHRDDFAQRGLGGGGRRRHRAAAQGAAAAAGSAHGACGQAET